MPAWEDCGCAAAAAAAGAPGEFDQHISLLAVVALRRRRWVALSAAFDPCAARGGAVALAGRDGRLSVPPSFPHSDGREPFMQCSYCQLPSSHAAGMAWIWGSCLQSRFLLSHTGVERVVSGGILASENHPWTDASAILLEECKIALLSNPLHRAFWNFVLC